MNIVVKEQGATEDDDYEDIVIVLEALTQERCTLVSEMWARAQRRLMAVEWQSGYMANFSTITLVDLPSRVTYSTPT
ncbi:hypothetical protein AOLI_G00286300, partial [Acnodon oligacanthus]